LVRPFSTAGANGNFVHFAAARTVKVKVWFNTLLLGAVMKKTALMLLFLLALLISALAMTLFVSLGKANPYMGGYLFSGEMSPEVVGAAPPLITILSPQENSTYGCPDILLNFNVSVGETPVNAREWIDGVYYKGDWEEGRHLASYQSTLSSRTEFSINVTVPEGKHEVTVWAEGKGSYSVDEVVYGFVNGLKGRTYTFHITGLKSVGFTVDTTSPSIAVLSVKNETYRTSQIPLDFTVNESVSQIGYCLDGQESGAVAGNMTLTDLSNGEHRLTVYATDEAGNAGASETIIFSVDVPFPTALVAAATSGMSVITAGLLFYFKKREH
jgi:hypothetical protein